VVADAHAQEKGPDRMAGPLRRDKPVLIPMYAEISQRPPPPRPFLNLLRSPVHLPLRCLVRALLGLSTVVVGAFSNTHHRDLSRPHKPLNGQTWWADATDAANLKALQETVRRTPGERLHRAGRLRRARPGPQPGAAHGSLVWGGRITQGAQTLAGLRGDDTA
jgi:hypothetical protein